MSETLSVSQAARRLSEELGRDIRPRDISLLFYHRELRDDLAPIVNGRRAIQPVLLPEIVRGLRRHGWLRRTRRASS